MKKNMSLVNLKTSSNNPILQIHRGSVSIKNKGQFNGFGSLGGGQFSTTHAGFSHADGAPTNDFQALLQQQTGGNKVFRMRPYLANSASGRKASVDNTNEEEKAPYSVRYNRSQNRLQKNKSSPSKQLKKSNSSINQSSILKSSD